MPTICNMGKLYILGMRFTNWTMEMSDKGIGRLNRELKKALKNNEDKS